MALDYLDSKLFKFSKQFNRRRLAAIKTYKISLAVSICVLSYITAFTNARSRILAAILAAAEPLMAAKGCC